MFDLKGNLLISSLLLLSVNSFAADVNEIIGEVPSEDPIEINGNIAFKGEITDSSCDITQKNIEVNLGSHSAALLKNRDDRTPTEAFDIVMTDCSLSMTSLKIKMTGTAHEDNAALYALDAGEKNAGNVGIVVMNEQDQPIIPGTPYQDIALKKDSRDYTLGYKAAYQATALVTPGTGNATINYTVSYQ
ncbi:major fimbrial subunit [Morganella morganii]|uniref:fimbrial protein n=1 Tax=Morganella morganii TaxID=582 RepID=UPI0006C40C73|nr:fimbrial protein [Morganella morganii]KOO19453.1 major fimbrial subunit [Morganella morganii]